MAGDDLSNLVDRLLTLGAVTDPAPRAAGQDDPERRARFDHLLRTNPVLARDSGYVRFLSDYDGLGLRRPDLGLSFGIFGFSYFWYDVLANDYPIVDPLGFAAIAEIQYLPPEARNTRITASFAVPDEPVRVAVHLAMIGPAHDLSKFHYDPFREDFMGFLETMVREAERDLLRSFLAERARDA